MTEEVVKERKPVLSIGDQPIYLEEDWDSGIGGGLWSTGLALAKYLGTDVAQGQLEHLASSSTSTAPLRVLELGSGNGFLGVCLLAACPKALLGRVVITDTQEHLPLIERTLEANNATTGGVVDRSKVAVEEYLWGTEVTTTNALVGPFDLIIGSDLAYRDELHDPLIQAILQFSSSPTTKTVTLLGVTMLDTKPIFFHKLNKAGLEYERLADHLLDPSFRGTSFAIFVIRKNTPE
jgi:predicted nicotinamide N-methyase